MDLYRIIGELMAERARVIRIIESLEGVENGSRKAPGGDIQERRGRKSMDPAARRDVSERMKKYWAKRRQNAPAA